MAIKVAINGFGRIGKCVFRAIYEYSRNKEFQVVGINNISEPKAIELLAKYDSTHGVFNKDLVVKGNKLLIEGDEISIFNERDPSKLPWGDLGVDVVLECSGFFRTKEKSMAHITAGAKKVLISAPAGNDIDATVVYGVNHNILKASDKVVSNASCTTNCLAPVAKPLHEKIGIKRGLMTTVHAYTNDQALADFYHDDFRRGRSATQSIIPTKTGAAAAVGMVLPELNGKLDGFALRVPVANVSVVDLSFTANKETSVEEINTVIKEAAAGELRGVLGVNELPLVSVDFNHTKESSIFDTSYTKVIGDFVKVLSWYDNEWAFSVRMLDVAKVMVTV